MEVTPRTVSHKLISEMFSKTDFQLCRKLSLFPGIPNKLFNWDDAIWNEPPQINPAMIGYEKNSMTKPTAAEFSYLDKQVCFDRT